MPEEGGVIGTKFPQSDAFGSSFRAASRLSDHYAPRRRPSSSGSLSSIELTSKMKAARHSRASRGSQRSRSQIGGNRPLEEVNNAKRLKVMNELWETEKAYVGGLDLIYTVCCIAHCILCSLDLIYPGISAFPNSVNILAFRRQPHTWSGRSDYLVLELCGYMESTPVVTLSPERIFYTRKLQHD